MDVVGSGIPLCGAAGDRSTLTARSWTVCTDSKKLTLHDSRITLCNTNVDFCDLDECLPIELHSLGKSD